MKTCAVIVAAGRGSRAQLLDSQSAGQTLPKQYVRIGGKPVLAWTLDVFLTHPAIDWAVVVIHPDDRSIYEEFVVQYVGAGERARLMPPVYGGHDRQASVHAGLDAIEPIAPQLVLIHDAARPFVSHASIDGVLEKLGDFDGAICAIPVTDTLKRADPSHDVISETVFRSDLWRAQTPQGFKFETILAAHRKAASVSGLSFTDDASVAEWAGLPVVLVCGDEANIKLTTREDIGMAEERLGTFSRDGLQTCDEIRVGSGFDVHRFGMGTHVWLCGVQIEHTHALIGHSDADVGLHALTDALLGALGEGDIGDHFPPTDPQWKGAHSATFLAHAAQILSERHGSVVNVDVTLICENPKIGPHRNAMREAISRILKVDISRVSVKATTSEGLGFTGRKEGIAAMASASVRLVKA